MTQEASLSSDRSAANPASASLRRLLDYPFRVFFLATGIWAVLAVPLWLLMLFGVIDAPSALPSLLWHQHEMLFGLLHPAIAGFLLTAVCVWTQTERLQGLPLLGLALVWLAGRITMLAGEMLPGGLVMAVNLAFLPLVMLDAGRRIVAVRQWRQLVLMVVLGALWAAQLGFWLAPYGVAPSVAMLATMLLMLVIGGRITPAFSAGWLRMRGETELAARIANRRWLERSMLALAAILLVAVVLQVSALVAVAALALAVVTAARIALWRGWRVRAEPLLWILHLSLAWIPVALLLLALGQFGLVPATAWLHAAGVGAMGGLILGVMSRVALGHTGRPLVLPAGIASAFVLIHAGAVLRVTAAVSVGPWLPLIAVSTLCWVIAYGLFVARYTPILLAPRPDGRPG
ncbi:NnrS family protein [Algiphilus aromaticivorans]|uniref:NnrS family protein n=1 Tax=Algiphilus aromaticivorans TaxID=382454 RepID=UPI000693AD70|nr:NnrS family protein [Algiphilus aromaticivorans]